MSDLEARCRAQLPLALAATALPGLPPPRRGKVRDLYRLDDARLLVVTTDRVSAFDRALGTAPFKGELLNALALEALTHTREVLPDHVLAAPDPAALVVRRCTPYPVEFVMRAHVTGSLWRDLESGRAAAYGLDLPAGLRRDAPLPAPILTPTTKAGDGAHDAPISRERIVADGLLTRARLDAAEAAARALFERGRAAAARRGLLLVDTKYELGEDADGRLTLIDEAHTPDSSRFWLAEGWEARLERGAPQRMLDKEPLRAWLLARGDRDGEGALPDDVRIGLTLTYADAHRHLLGRTFAPEVGDPAPRLARNLAAAGLVPG